MAIARASIIHALTTLLLLTALAAVRAHAAPPPTATGAPTATEVPAAGADDSAESAATSGKTGIVASLNDWLGAEAFEVVWRVALALLLFLAGWILAKLLAWLLFRLLCKTSVDDKLAKKLGFELVVDTEEDENRLERWISRIVYYLLMLFVVVGVLQFVGLTQVASPIQGFVDTIVGAIPFVGKALVILLAAYVVALVLKKVVTMGLETARIDERFDELRAPEEVEAAGDTGVFSTNAGRVVFWLVMIIGVSGALDALEISALSEPLRNMLDRIIGFLPALAVAALILAGGYVIARIARTVVANLLDSVGFDRFIDKIKFGRLFGSSKASRVMGTIVFLFVLLQALIAALHRIGLQTLSDPLTKMMDEFWLLLPNLAVAVLFVAVAYVVARAVRDVVEKLLVNLGFDDLMAKLGFDRLKEKTDTRQNPSAIIGLVAQIAIILIAIAQALQNLELTTWAGYLNAFLDFAFDNVLIALLIVLVGYVLGNYVHGMIDSRAADAAPNRWLATLARYAILVFAVTMAIHQLQVAQDFVIISFALLFGALCLAMALAFGLGSREVAGEIVRERYEKARAGFLGEEPAASEEKD